MLRLSATTVKYFFQYRCDRQARYNLMTSQDRKGIVTGKEHAMCDKWAKAGDDFEKQVVDALASTESVLAATSPEKVLSPETTAAFLRTKQRKRTPHNSSCT